ncbi:JM37 [macacine gammaherpesvirus 11]|uniref:JM37 n=2 Tax=macacine gammaherpesvirus 11 TaxID=2560570 RepID=G9JM45_9GAMA|nr:JM37 [Macaca fuscata rhadinovirus]AAT00014.1 JM37 [Macaca fuscata rhadinovirus]AEW87562.1 JM37 [Macaca fuscata rhadinovirus]AEW87732.1 JM37 [Macaca fuscata rhadinovirus]
MFNFKIPFLFCNVSCNVSRIFELAQASCITREVNTSLTFFQLIRYRVLLNSSSTVDISLLTGVVVAGVKRTISSPGTFSSLYSYPLITENVITNKHKPWLIGCIAFQAG